MARKHRGVETPVDPDIRLLACDLGGKCGWAEYYNGEITSGTWKLVKSKTKSHSERAGMRFVRFKNELDTLNGMVPLNPVKHVYYEEVHAHAGTDAAHAYGGFRAILMAWCENGFRSYGSFAVGTIKKRATGKGNSKKPAVIAAANKTFKKILGRAVTDDNEADALWILVLAMEKHGIQWKTLRPRKNTN